MKVLVFGGTGFLGRRVVERLRQRGARVSLAARPGAALPGPDVAVVPLDLAAAGELPEVGAQDAALFLAQSRRDRDWPVGAPDMAAVNVAGLVRALELARRAGAGRFVAASSGSVYRPSFAPLAEDAEQGGGGFYALSKRLGERAAAAYAGELELLTIRPFTLYGPGQRGRLVANLVRAVAAGRLIHLAPARLGEARPEGFTVSPSAVDDAAEVVVRLLDDSSTGALNLAGGEAVSVRRIARLAGEALGREPRFRVLAEPRAGDLVADVSRLQRLVDLEPRPFRRGLAELLERDPEIAHVAPAVDQPE